jgi:hypothetical protein
MVIPQLKSLFSPDLEPPALPTDVSDCCVLFQASIGPKDAEGEELFTFEVVTPRYLERSGLPCWGRGLLIVDSFTWQAVGGALAALLAQAHRGSWRETAEALNHDLQWAFDSHKPFSGDA